MTKCAHSKPGSVAQRQGPDANRNASDLSSFRDDPPWTLPLDDLGAADVRQVGGKAFHLALLLRHRLPVPRGFCVTTAAFRLFLRAHPALSDLLRSTSELNAPDFQAAINALPARIAMPPAIEWEVARACQKHGEDRNYAVRSSATVEDAPEHSFAGQFVTCLNVRGRDAVLDAILRCWMSLFSAPSLAYHACRHLSLTRTAMGIVVQEMVPADLSGVLFTVDPRSGRADRILIESAPGLGDQLVSGRVNPVRVILSKSRPRILRRDPPESHVPDRRALMRLRRLALTIERLLGRPVDVEWAAANRRIFILQARAATRVAPMKSWEDRQVWSNVNTGEVMPDVATPMTWSVIQLLIGPVIRSLFRMMGANADLAPAVGLVAGRVYFNANTGKAAMKPFWFLLRRISNFAQALGGGHVGEYYRDLLEIPDADLPDLGFSWPRYVLSWPRILMDLIRHSPRRGDAWTERVRLQTAELARVDLERMSTAELADFYARMLSLEFEGWDLLYLATQAVALPFFQKACHDWLDDPHLTLGYRLFAGLGGLPEVEAGLALWRLAALAQADELTRAVITAGEDWPQTRRRLEQTAPGRQFLEAWTGFMTEHGHHCRGELELINVRWCEQPDYILGLLRGYVNSAGRLNPPENQERLARERLQLTEACRRRLRNPVKRWIFQASLKRAQQLAVNREVWKDQAVRRIFILRRLLVLLGHGLSGQGVLGTSDDIFFLETGELHRILQGEVTFDVRDCVRRRRLEYEIHRQIPAGPGIVGGCAHGRSATPNPRQNGEEDILKGIPVSPGIVTGRARVILRDNDHEHILPGEILVAPFTDPAWTPYFVTASGVIMEQGGILSHGSIVAREFGLPAVTNVEAVTRRLRTGDLVELDGDRGRVTVLHPG